MLLSRTTLPATLITLTLFTSFFTPHPAAAAIFGSLEAPDDFATGIGNVQGWAYTTTPGAELIQPFDVLVNGEVIMGVPCCSPRGDVQDVHPEAPLDTGFSGVTNWAREVEHSPITVQVRVRDTAGGELLLTQTNVAVFALGSFPFSSSVGWAEAPSAAAVGAQAGGAIASRCTLANTGTFTPGAAELICTNVVATRGEESEVCRGLVRYSWDRASQGFKQTTSCVQESRWTLSGDGTATDNTTGLVWELKTDDGTDECGDVHDKDCVATWAVAGTESTITFLLQLNGGHSADGATTSGCFADRCDWRLPTIGELRGILATDAPGCTSDPCTTIPGETATAPQGQYWSGSLHDSLPEAWYANFSGPDLGTSLVGSGDYSLTLNVRAVAGTSRVTPEASPPPEPECDPGDACNDGNACTENDSCTADGQCEGTPLDYFIDIVDADPCTLDYCDPVLGVQHDLTVGSCDDGDPCTENDVCNILNGECAGEPVEECGP